MPRTTSAPPFRAERPHGPTAFLRFLVFALGLALVVGPARAGPPIVVPVPVPVNPSYCWPELKLFDTLRYGPVDFCRKRLAYAPGRLECAQVSEQVCWVLLADGQWILTRSPVGTQVIPCPDGPEPPVCPRLTFE